MVRTIVQQGYICWSGCTCLMSQDPDMGRGAVCDTSLQSWVTQVEQWWAFDLEHKESASEKSAMAIICT